MKKDIKDGVYHLSIFCLFVGNGRNAFSDLTSGCMLFTKAHECTLAKNNQNSPIKPQKYIYLPRVSQLLIIFYVGKRVFAAPPPLQLLF